jgi:hypothetical protein
MMAERAEYYQLPNGKYSWRYVSGDDRVLESGDVCPHLTAVIQAAERGVYANDRGFPVIEYVPPPPEPPE